jgi:hypothetical protein
MQLNKHNSSDKKYISILSDGKFHQTVEDGTPGSIVREYEDKEGNMKQKVELVFDDVVGKITNVSFEEGEFGKNINIEIDNEGIISAGVATNFAEDLMKKIPAIDLAKEVKLVPYAFVTKEGKNKKGVTVYQDGEKVESAYYNADTKKATNGIPQPEGDTAKFDSDDWKMHFMKVRKFLIGKIEEQFEPTSELEAITSLEEELSNNDKF